MKLGGIILNNQNNLQARDSFATRLGLVLAAAGSAIGLGNVWKFPYITGENGGAAFILVYLICIALIGLPVMVAELSVGRKAGKSTVSAFKKFAPKSVWITGGVTGVLAALLIMFYYPVIAGWAFAYVFKSLFSGLTTLSPEGIGEFFGNYISGIEEPIFWQLVVVIITCWILVGGVKDGIEKWSKLLMPTLFVILVILVIRSLTLQGAAKGVAFLWYPDFSKLTMHGVLTALGHSFFTLSLGMGIMVTYGSYVSKSEDLSKTAIMVTIADTSIALMAGLAIFPAVFAFGFEPGHGPGLVFVTLPAVFSKMPLGSIFSALFFLLLGIAALTSTMSLTEVVVAYLVDEHNWSRTKSIITTGIVFFIFGVPASLAMGPWAELKFFGLNYFDLLDYFSSNILLPLGGLLVALFVGFRWGVQGAIDEVSNGGKIKSSFINLYGFVIKYIAPVLILIVFLNALGLLDKL
ncbi:MAG: neurotransmitter:Na+ symporter, family [Clostridiales bacterium]|jgi:NSS family neurotransmitter:Na+ symporter|nr:neurotransmitter:Na+ symporter, family [Clostridiales bacterium]MDK2934093.1 neurotransmitter:Na+ symporter, family [Clostridiales bacterium]